MPPPSCNARVQFTIRVVDNITHTFREMMLPRAMRTPKDTPERRERIARLQREVPPIRYVRDGDRFRRVEADDDHS